MTDPKPSVSSTALSAPADEHDEVSSAVLSALECVEGFDGFGDDEKVNTAPKVRAPFGAEANQDTETSSRMSIETASGSPSTKARKATNVDEFRRKFGGNERSSAGAMEAATAPPGLYDLQGAERPSAGAMKAATALPGLYDLQGEPVPTHRGDEGGYTTVEADPVIQEAEATLVTDDPNTITELAVFPMTEDTHITTETALVPGPLPVRKWWTSRKWQWGGGLILCLIVVGIAIGVAVGVSGGSDDKGEPSPSPLAQLLPTYLQEAILVEDTPEAWAFEWLEDDPGVSNFTKLELLQRFALVTLYYATGGENWINKTGWLDYNVAECDWFTYDSFDSCIGGRYRQLILSENGLAGELPNALGVLTDLRTMNLSNNDLTGHLSSYLGSLTQLRDIALNLNALSGSVPSEYGLLVNLNNLELYANDLIGQLPSTLGSLSQLTNLDLEGNLLSGPLPSEYGMLVNLESMYLDKNALTGHLPSSLGSLSLPKFLYLPENRLSGPVPSEFGFLMSLEVLRLHGNKLAGRLPSTLGSLSQLRILGLDSNLLSGPVPSEFGLLLNLEYMFLFDNALTGQLPSNLGSMSRCRI
jgi:hypothetical protein